MSYEAPIELSFRVTRRFGKIVVPTELRLRQLVRWSFTSGQAQSLSLFYIRMDTLLGYFLLHVQVTPADFVDSSSSISMYVTIPSLRKKLLQPDQLIEPANSFPKEKLGI